MDIFTAILIALGLAMDTFAVSIAKGIVIEHRRRKSALLLASFFAGFQMLMPAIGYFAGFSLSEVIMR
jgi:putative Mn2+ efflux pump MntP